MMDKKNKHQTRGFCLRAATSFFGDSTHDIEKNKTAKPDVKETRSNGGICGVQLTKRAENDHRNMAKYPLESGEIFELTASDVIMYNLNFSDSKSLLSPLAVDHPYPVHDLLDDTMRKKLLTWTGVIGKKFLEVRPAKLARINHGKR
jgi:hypothetical protein